MIQAERIVPTTCPYCGVGCNLELHIRDEYIFQVTSPYDNPVNHGNLCVKGRFGYDYLYHPARVTVPLIRPGAEAGLGARPRAALREPAQWRQATWEEALDLVARRLVEIYGASGSDALAVYCCAKATNEDNYLMQKLFRSQFATNNVDHCTRLCHAGSVVALQMALGSSAMSNVAGEVIYNDVFIVTGSNTAETHPIIAIQMKAAVEKYGAKLIVVDPRRIELANWATLYLAQRPGTDVPLFSAMAHVILKEQLYNEAFVRERTENFDEFAASMEPFTPEYAEMVSGVPRDLIVQAARLYATAKNGAIYWALGIPEHSHGTDNAMSLVHLALLTGHIGRLGTGLNPLRGQNNVQGASDAGAMPWHYPGYQEVDNEDAARKFEAAWGGPLSRARGLTTTEILGSVGAPGGVRALYVMGENPMMSEPDLTHTEHQVRELDFLVAQDLFINETGQYADVFLPTTSWAEKDGTFTNTDRRVQRVRRALAPRGQSRPDWEIICDLGRRVERLLGREHSARWDYADPGEVLAEMGALVPAYRGVTYARLEKLGGLHWPVPDEQHPGTTFLFAESFPRGRGRFHPLTYVPAAEPPDDEYPFVLTTGRVLEHWHGGTMTRHSALDELYPEALVEISPADGARLGIASGTPVRVTSRRGTVVARAQVSTKANDGTVFLPFHFSEAAANLLTLPTLDPLAKIPEYKACAVRLEVVAEAELANPEARTERGRW
jgi:formate dehydrogenase alpha subunit